MGLGTVCDLRGQVKSVVGLDPCCDTPMGLPHLLNLESTGPIRFEVGGSSSLADPRPLTREAHKSVMVASSKTGHDISVAQIEVMTCGACEGGRQLYFQWVSHRGVTDDTG